MESSLQGRLEASKERWRDRGGGGEQHIRDTRSKQGGGGEAESSLQERLEASKERWRHEEGERDRDEPSRRDREMSRGQRAAYEGD